MRGYTLEHGAVLDFRNVGPRLPDRYREAQEIYGGYFEPKLLKGFGMLMAVNEVVSHCELIEISGGAE